MAARATLPVKQVSERTVPPAVYVPCREMTATVQLDSVGGQIDMILFDVDIPTTARRQVHG